MKSWKCLTKTDTLVFINGRLNIYHKHKNSILVWYIMFPLTDILSFNLEHQDISPLSFKLSYIDSLRLPSSTPLSIHKTLQHSPLVSSIHIRFQYIFILGILHFQRTQFNLIQSHFESWSDLIQ